MNEKNQGFVVGTVSSFSQSDSNTVVQILSQEYDKNLLREVPTQYRIEFVDYPANNGTDRNYKGQVDGKIANGSIKKGYFVGAKCKLMDDGSYRGVSIFGTGENSSVKKKDANELVCCYIGSAGTKYTKINEKGNASVSVRTMIDGEPHYCYFNFFNSRWRKMADQVTKAVKDGDILAILGRPVEHFTGERNGKEIDRYTVLVSKFKVLSKRQNESGGSEGKSQQNKSTPVKDPDFDDLDATPTSSESAATSAPAPAVAAANNPAAGKDFDLNSDLFDNVQDEVFDDLPF